MIVFRGIDKNYPSLNCAPLKMYLTAVKTFSKIASVGEEQDAIFETVFTAVRYIYNGS